MTDFPIFSRPLVALVVLNWNGALDTIESLKSLSKLTYTNHIVVLVDNGSSDNSITIFKTYDAMLRFQLIETGRNLGYAGGNNVGIRAAIDQGADFVLVLNNDTTVAPDLIERLLDAANENPDAGVFSARVLYYNDPQRVWFDRAHWNPRTLSLEWPGQGSMESDLPTTATESDYGSGAALFFRTEVVNEIGLLDEDFFLVWEEVDWCFRARKAGWKVISVPRAKVWHKIGVSFGSESSPLRTYFSTRNKLLWFSRHAPWSARIRLWTQTLRRLVPRFVLGGQDGPIVKRLAWALQDYLAALSGRGNRLQYLATRRAILDYLSRRFGDCPDEVRQWSRTWSAKQRSV